MEIQLPSAAAEAREWFPTKALVLWSIRTVSSTSEPRKHSAHPNSSPVSKTCRAATPSLISPNKRSRPSSRWPPGARRSHSHGDRVQIGCQRGTEKSQWKTCENIPSPRAVFLSPGLAGVLLASLLFPSSETPPLWCLPLPRVTRPSVICRQTGRRCRSHSGKLFFFGLPASLPAAESSSLRSAQTPSARRLARLRPRADDSRLRSERRRVGYLHFPPLESENKGKEDKKREIRKLIFLSKNSFQIQHQPPSSDVAERHQSRAGAANQSAARRVKLPEPPCCSTHLQITPWMLLIVSHA